MQMVTPQNGEIRQVVIWEDVEPEPCPPVPIGVVAPLCVPSGSSESERRGTHGVCTVGPAMPSTVSDSPRASGAAAPDGADGPDEADGSEDLDEGRLAGPEHRQDHLLALGVGALHLGPTR
jgi:hypothetical protein